MVFDITLKKSVYYKTSCFVVEKCWIYIYSTAATLILFIHTIPFVLYVEITDTDNLLIKQCRYFPCLIIYTCFVCGGMEAKGLILYFAVIYNTSA